MAYCFLILIAGVMALSFTTTLITLNTDLVSSAKHIQSIHLKLQFSWLFVASAIIWIINFSQDVAISQKSVAALKILTNGNESFSWD